MLRYSVLALCLLLLSGPTLAAGQIELIQLQNRSAEELIPLLRPMLPAQTTISGTGYKLIVRSTPSGHKEIRALLAQLDSAPAQLIISVRQGGEQETQQTTGGLSARYQRGDGSLGVGERETGGRGGLQVESSTGNLQGRINAQGRQQERRENITQRLRVTEGHWATIQSGQSVPLSRQALTPTRSGTLVRRSTEYHAVTTGFEVRPRLNGDRVSLEIRPQRNRLSSQRDGTIATQSLSTSVSGRLGAWIELGNTQEITSGQRQGINTRGKTRTRSDDSIYLKVETVP